MKINNILKRSAFTLFVIAGFVGVSTSVANAQEKNEKQNSKLAAKARITLSEAREIALKAAPGKVEGEELEMEAKLRKTLVYSFDIRNSKGTITEIWVSAKTGKILHKAEETAEDEAKERERDTKKN
ncbi:MAG: PepSY domain-containing protein [Acidobacteria bacterium]|nr:PepSY domain-containing protein [Acidobacteriota bacterium]